MASRVVSASSDESATTDNSHAQFDPNSDTSSTRTASSSVSSNSSLSTTSFSLPDPPEHEHAFSTLKSWERAGFLRLVEHEVTGFTCRARWSLWKIRVSAYSVALGLFTAEQESTSKAEAKLFAAEDVVQDLLRCSKQAHVAAPNDDFHLQLLHDIISQRTSQYQDVSFICIDIKRDPADNETGRPESLSVQLTAAVYRAHQPTRCWSQCFVTADPSQSSPVLNPKTQNANIKYGSEAEVRDMVATAIRHTGRDGSVVLLGHNIKAHAGWLEGLETGDGVLVCDIALAFQALYRVPAETSLAHKMKVCNIEVDQACHECMDSIGGLRVFVRMLNVATVMGGKG